MKVLHTNFLRGWGGQSNRILTECIGLAANGWDILVSAPGESELLKRSREANLAVDDSIKYVGGLRRGTIGDIKAMRRLLEDFRPDIVHLHGGRDSWAYAGAVALMPRAKRPITIRTKHNVFPVKDHLLNQWQYGRLFDSIVCLSSAIKLQLQEKKFINPQRLVTIPSAIDAQDFEVDPEVRPQIRAEFGYAADELVIGITGRLRREKAHDVLFRAVPIVMAAYPKARFVCFGSGSLGTDLADSLEAAGVKDYVKMAGFRTDVPACLAALDIYTQPSRSEGLGTSILEAGAAGLPIVATDCGGIPDIVLHENTGLLVPVENPEALASALIRLLQNAELRQRLGAAAREHVKAHFSVEALVEKTDQHYRNMLARRAG